MAEAYININQSVLFLTSLGEKKKDGIAKATPTGKTHAPKSIKKKRRTKRKKRIQPQSVESSLPREK